MCNYCDEWDNTPFKRLASYGKNVCPDCNPDSPLNRNGNGDKKKTQDSLERSKYIRSNEWSATDEPKTKIPDLGPLDIATDIYNVHQSGLDLMNSQPNTTEESQNIVRVFGNTLAGGVGVINRPLGTVISGVTNLITDQPGFKHKYNKERALRNARSKSNRK